MASIPNQPKREYSSFPVIYWGEDDKPKEIIQVRPVPLRGVNGRLRDVNLLQEELIKAFVLHNACIGALIDDDLVWAKMVTMASLLPVIGKEKPGFEIESLAEWGDIPQLGRIFFTESITLKGEHELDEDGQRPLTKPSSVARIHDLNFHTPLFRYDEERRERLHSERMTKIESNLEQVTNPAATGK